MEQMTTTYATVIDAPEQAVQAPARSNGAGGPDLSIVIPMYNEVDNIPPLYEELTGVLETLPYRYEVIAIDDGSRDGTFKRLKAVYEQDPRWRVIRFRRNFGQSAGLTAGFQSARGEIVITMDADLQNDPAYIPEMLALMEEGYDIVSGWRKDRKEPFLKRRLPSMTANWLISRVTGVQLHDYGCTLKAYRAEIAHDIRLYGEMHRFTPALASWMGVEITEVPIEDRPRRFGKSKYGLGRTFKVILDLITVSFLLGFLTRPLQFFGTIGSLAGGLGTLFGLYIAYSKLFLGESADRPLLLLAVLLVVLGVQLVSIGLVAEIVVRSYHEPRGKPMYVVRERLEADPAEE